MNIYRSKLSTYNLTIQLFFKRKQLISVEKCKLMVFQKAIPLGCDNLEKVINILYR